ncbi:uncharacterized protein SPPG_06013 [Spizellomyces punctatus DAOM BR117]|uniref:Uncharacterized protein n=1 Tax=Spizellomyces punctatus (strain DAOM BR117) TaxID=645134 RepID=A0A0L0HDN3_SPIPD|nr:uncharacterized protein SPPG_06013 [Spizellomyces punctatus DAOM BR117]KNC99064.1 hypothetical protein SPPG_06013 [Spizellomyces punctatus DAOM BR117]|eukprot:XP_016607104.1 hypothetical protein SPPG_06013 [Spizellomyces punctatus DAOM BR117]
MLVHVVKEVKRPGWFTTRLGLLVRAVKEELKWLGWPRYGSARVAWLDHGLSVHMCEARRSPRLRPCKCKANPRLTREAEKREATTVTSTFTTTERPGPSQVRSELPAH